MVINVAKQNVVENLDYYAAKFAQEIVVKIVDEKIQEANEAKETNKTTDPEKTDPKKIKSRADNAVTKSLGVLQEQGVYACFLYLVAKEKDNCKPIVAEMLKMLEKIGVPEIDIDTIDLEKNPQELLKHINEHITQDLDLLLLAREVLEQVLIYARYGIKARD